VLAADAAAQAAGGRAGMPLTHGPGPVPGLIVQDAEPAADAEALERLAVWLFRYAPIVAPDPPDGLIIDSTGADHLHGGEAVMLDGLIGRLAMSGITARAAIADTWEQPMRWPGSQRSQPSSHRRATTHRSWSGCHLRLCASRLRS